MYKISQNRTQQISKVFFSILIGCIFWMTGANLSHAQFQEGFRFRDDDGSESTASWLAPQDSPITFDINDPLRFRALIQGTTTASTTRYGLQFKKSTDSLWSPVGVDMPTPTIMATSSARDTGNSTSHTVTLPAGTQVGDLLLVVMSCDGGTLINEVNGWERHFVGYNTTIVSSAIYWQFATTTSPLLTVGTAASEECSHVSYRIEGAGAPHMVSANGSGTNSNPPNLITSGTRDYLWIAARSGDSTVVATVAPTNFTNMITLAANTTGGASTNAATRSFRASSQDPGTFTSATEQWVAWTIAVPPAETPATGNVTTTLFNALTGATSSATGSLAWSNPGNITSSNNARASVTLSNTTASHYLIASSSSMFIPGYATITGIEVYVETLQSSVGGTTGSAQFNSVNVMKNGAVVGTTQTNATAWTTTEKQFQFGSSSALWGTTWTPADFNSGFAVAMTVRGAADYANRIANIDHVIVRVFYTVPPAIGYFDSTNISASGASTTAQLAPPGGLSTSDFLSGRIQDDENPTDTILIPANDYTEVEWSLVATGTATTGVAYDLRISNSTTTALSSYNDTAQWTIGTYMPSSVSVWNATDWTLYDTITIDATKVDATLTDFPVYVDLADLSDQFWATTPTGTSTVGTDIRVTTNDGTPVELARELVAASSTAQTGELHFKANSISATTDTVFRIYYNGTTTGDYSDTTTYGAESVWTNEYVGVWHMNESPGGTAPQIIDSTSYGQDATAAGSMNVSDMVTGRVGSGLDFASTSSQYLSFGAAATVSGAYTISSWAKPADTVVDRGIFTNRVSDENTFDYKFSGGTVVHGDIGNGTAWLDITADQPLSYTAGTWHHTAYSVNTAGYTLYVDNNVSSEAFVGTPLLYTSGNTPRIGTAGGTGTEYFTGVIDEFRIASTTRTAAWISAEYTNQATANDFYRTATGETGSSTIANHDVGQVSNAFDSRGKTDETLFAFKLTPNSGNATTTQLEFEVSGYDYLKLNTTDFTNIRLYRDLDSDGTYDLSDMQVGGAGVFSLLSVNNEYGTIVFTDDFAATTSLNYILVADWTAPANGSYMTIDLSAAGVTMQDNVGGVTAYGSVDHIQHNRISSGGGGGGSAAGGDAPAGAGNVGGGVSGGGNNIDTNTGGNTIGGSPDFYWPTAHSGSWNNIANAYDQVDGTYATTSSANTSTFSDYNNVLPDTNTIQGVVVKLELSGTTAAGNIGIELSWDGGSSWTSTGYTTATLTTTDAVVSVGGPANTWGRSWSPGEFSNANFRVRLSGNPSSNEIRVDAIQVRVYHQAGGGGGGGGGAI